MDKLIVGKKYYVSDVNLEKAKEYKGEGHPDYLYTWDGDYFIDQLEPTSWSFWVRAEEEMDKLIIGNEYYVSNKSVEAAKEHRLCYVWTKSGFSHSGRTQPHYKFWVAVEPSFRDSNGEPLEIGDMVRVANSSLAATSDSKLHEFIGMVNEYYVSKSWDEVPFAAKYAVKPKPKPKLVKDPVSLMKQLVADGYSFYPETGSWRKHNHQFFVSCMWQYCGQEPSPSWTWEPQWLED